MALVGSLPVIVIGGGLAGLFTALKLAPLPVTVIAGTPLGRGASSNWAQGGVAAAIGPGDSPGAHVIDTIKAGAGLVDREMATILAQSASDRILDLLSYGAPFDQDIAGALELGREAAHSTRRIVKVSGDQAGFAIMQALIAATRSADHVKLLEDVFVRELVKKDGRVCGACICGPTDKDQQTFETLPARAVVLATGGIGQAFATTTNPKAVRGDGLAMAAAAGAVIRDAEFVQFHPTALCVGEDPAPLASEALRGEGARLVNKAGEFFMQNLHELGDLAPRDVVARAVFAQQTAGLQPALDCTRHPGALMPEHFSKVTSSCLAAGFDPQVQLVPVTPAAHFHMGGIATNGWGQTSLTGLFACGEVAASGVHGANRLAGNSLLEALVFGDRIAKHIAQMPLSQIMPEPRQNPRQKGAELTRQQVVALRHLMSNKVGVIRNESGLQEALAEISDLLARGIEDNLLNVALLVTVSAHQRKESRGGHFRSDFPKPLSNWQRHSSLTGQEALHYARSKL